MPADVEFASSSDGERQEVHDRLRRGTPWRLLGCVAAGTALVVVPAVVALMPRPGQGAVAAVQQQIEVIPKMEDCAGPTENCFSNKCCKVSGTSCWHIQEGSAKCGKFCPPGSPCFVEKPWYAFKASKDVGTSLYCYTVALTLKGPELMNSKELEILEYQASLGAGIFSCNDHIVFSDKAVDLGSGAAAVQLPVPALYTELFRQDKPDHYLNTPIFKEAWRHLSTEGKYLEFDWVVKVDPATVFLPEVLRSKLPKQDPTTGSYLVNCPGVLEGYFGSLEVASKTAFKRFMEQFEGFYKSSCWKWETEACREGWKWGPWGEDLFMQRCMDGAEVGKLEDMDIVETGTCPKMRPASQRENKSYVPPCTPGMSAAAVHPFRTKDAWEECYAKLTR